MWYDVCRPNDTSPASVICWMSLEPGWVHLQSTGDAVIETGWNPFAILYHQYIISMVNVLSKNIHLKLPCLFQWVSTPPCRSGSFFFLRPRPGAHTGPGPGCSADRWATAQRWPALEAQVEPSWRKTSRSFWMKQKILAQHQETQKCRKHCNLLRMTPNDPYTLYIPYPLARSFHHL